MPSPFLPTPHPACANARSQQGDVMTEMADYILAQWGASAGLTAELIVMVDKTKK